MAASILSGMSRMQQCAQFQTYHSESLSGQVSRRSSEGTAVECAVKHTVRSSIKVRNQATLMYYLHRGCNTQSDTRRAASSSSRDGPWERDLPAAAARSSLLSAPITGASVPTKTNSVVQPSEQPLPLPELLLSSPAARGAHKCSC